MERKLSSLKIALPGTHNLRTHNQLTEKGKREGRVEERRKRWGRGVKKVIKAEENNPPLSVW